MRRLPIVTFVAVAVAAIGSQFIPQPSSEASVTRWVSPRTQLAAIFSYPQTALCDPSSGNCAVISSNGQLATTGGGGGGGSSTVYNGTGSQTLVPSSFLGDGGTVATTANTFTNGQYAPFQTDANGYLKVNVAVGGGGSGSGPSGTSGTTITPGTTGVPYYQGIGTNGTTPVTGTVSLSAGSASIGNVSLNAGTNAIGSITNTAFAINGPLPAGTNVIGGVNAQLDASTTGTITATDAVVAAPAGTGTTVTGASTAGSFVALQTPNGVSGWNVQITGNASTPLYFEESEDSTTGTDGNWIAVNGRQTGTGGGVATIGFTTTLTNVVFRGNMSGSKWFRVRAVGTLGGTPAVSIRFSTGTGAVFLNSALPGGNNTIGAISNTAFSLNAGSNAIGSITNTTFGIGTGFGSTSGNPLFVQITNPSSASYSSGTGQTATANSFAGQALSNGTTVDAQRGGPAGTTVASGTAGIAYGQGIGPNGTTPTAPTGCGADTVFPTATTIGTLLGTAPACAKGVEIDIPPGASVSEYISTTQAASAPAAVTVAHTYANASSATTALAIQFNLANANGTSTPQQVYITNTVAGTATTYVSGLPTFRWI